MMASRSSACAGCVLCAGSNVTYFSCSQARCDTFGSVSRLPPAWRAARPAARCENGRERSSCTTNHLRQRASRGHCWHCHTCRRPQPRERCGSAHLRGDHQVPVALRARAARLNVGACAVASDHAMSACDEPSGCVYEARSTLTSTSTSRFARTRLGERARSFGPRSAGWVYQELLAPRHAAPPPEA